MPKTKNVFTHIQLNTDDPAAAKQFYKKLFDWKLSDVEMGPEMVYTFIDTGSRVSTGGIQKRPLADAPPSWMTYVEVADVKKTIAKAEKLGAKILVAYQPIPDMGAFGVFTDPTGATIGVWGAEKKPPKRGSRKGRR